MKIASQPSNGIDLNVTFDGRTFTLPCLIEHVRGLESAQDQLVGEQLKTDPTKPYVYLGGHDLPGVKQTMTDAGEAFTKAFNDAILQSESKDGVRLLIGPYAATKPSVDAATLEKLAAKVRIAGGRNRRAQRRLESARAAVSIAEEDVAFSKNQLVDAHQKLDAFIDGGQA